MGLRPRSLNSQAAERALPELKRTKTTATWRERFARALEAVAAKVGTIELPQLADGEDVYRATNARVLGAEAARTLWRWQSPATAGMMVEGFAAAARARGVPVLRLDPRLTGTSRAA